MTQKKFFIELQSAFWQFQAITVSECCLVKLLPCILFEKNAFYLQKYVNILALKWPARGTGTVPSAGFRWVLLMLQH